MAKKPKLLADLFHETLKDVYFAENRILKALPKMAKAAQSKDLKAAFVKHEKETHGEEVRSHHGHHQGRRRDHVRLQGNARA
jgi:ferritin-like metal-binding protein YciE